MRIGVPKEIKNNEYRVALTPTGVSTFQNYGHEVFIEKDAGIGSGFTNKAYEDAGAKIVYEAFDIWENAEIILKVKEPLPTEFQYFRKGLILFTFLHLAAEPLLTKALKDSQMIAIAYETVSINHSLPLLTPMSEVAGRMATQIGAQLLEKFNGGKGILLGGVPGVKRGKVTIIGGGVVGTNAAKIAIGLGASVTLIDVNSNRLRELDDIFGNSISTLTSSPHSIAQAVSESDLVIGAVLIPGAKAPKLVTENMVQTMSPGSVIIDVAIDQGGIFETITHTNTHDHPTYLKHDVVHYAVSNMPGAVPQTSTIALTNVTIPYALQIANLGIKQALATNKALASGVNLINGLITLEAVAEDLGENYTPLLQALNF